MTQPITILSRHQVASLLAKRPHDSHKGMFGTVTVIGGASGMVGAALLAARAALKLGAGCVHVGLLAEDAPMIDFMQPELMLHKASEIPHPLHRHPHPNNGEGANMRNLFNSGVLALGCGMGRSRTAQQILHDALSNPATLILDADALNLIAQYVGLRRLLTLRAAPTLLTPHPGEAARLLSCSTAEIQADRRAAVTKLAGIFACAVVLKGADSLCITRGGRLFMNPTGNPGMSAPGMGDVLAGMIAAFSAQGLSADDALLLAVYLHGAAGDELAKHTAIGMTASELTEQARQLLSQWTMNNGGQKLSTLPADNPV